MVVCQYFLKGDCRFGDRCRFEHPAAKKTTVCPHFLRGYCRFGDECWNDHPRGGGGGRGFGHQRSFGNGSSFGGYKQSSNRSAWGSSYTSQNRFEVLSGGQTKAFGGQHGRVVESAQNAASQIQQVISKDMEIWETSSQWPLSCYTYTKEEPCLRGLMDISPEEVRFEAYKANAEGKADAYRQGLKDHLTSIKQRKLELSRMSASQLQEEVKSQRSINIAPASSPVGGGSSFQSHQQLNKGSGIFGSGLASQSSGVFGVGNISSQSNAFLGTGNSANQSGGLFGTGNSSNPLGAPFGINPTTSQSTGFLGSASFNNQSGGGIFGQSTPTTQTGGLFGNNSPTNQPSSLFGVSGNSATISQSGFVNSQILDGSSPQLLSKGLFGGKTGPKTGSFGASTEIGSVFGGESSQNDSGVVASNPPTSAASTLSSKPSLGSSRAISLSCSEEDLKAFKSDYFVLGKIPECPPPPELC